MKKIINILAFNLICILAFGCIAPTPDKDLIGPDRDVYITNYDLTAKFSNYKTFSIVDSISLNIDGSTGKSGGTTAILLLTAVRDEMLKKGYVLLTDTTQTPDVGVDVLYQSFTTTNVGSYYPSYSGYYGYYGYPSYYTYQVSNDALLVQMVDLKNPVGGNFNVVWNANIVGDFDAAGSDSEFNQRLVNGIKGSFSQSPYLQVN